MLEGERTLTDAQVVRLAAMVKNRLGDLCDPMVRAPLPCDYRAERHWSPHNYHDFAVDIDIGSTVLTLRSENGAGEPMFGASTDLDAMSKQIMMHVLLAKRDEKGAEILATAFTTCSAKIEQDRSGLELISVRFAPALTDRPARLFNRDLWVRVGMLDNMLLPHVELITGRTVKEIGSELALCSKAQVARRAALERLASSEAGLEIEATAEYAIMASGRDVGGVVREMIGARGIHDGYCPRVLLYGDRALEHVSVRASDGRIHVEAEIGPLSWYTDSEIVVRRTFPEAITDALAGRPLRTLLDHRLLQGDAEIETAIRRPGGTEVKLRSNARPICRDEVRGID